MAQVKAERRGGSTYYVELPDGTKHKYAGVTTVLNEVSKPFLMTWAAEQAAQAVFDNPAINMSDAKKAHLQVRDAAGDRGTRVHKFAEDWEDDEAFDPANIPTDIRGYVVALHDFMQTTKWETLYNEVVVVSDTYEYAGTADRVVRDHEGNIVLLDYKTSKSVHEWDNGLQLAAYANGDFIIDADSRKPLPLPRIDRAEVVHLKPGGTWSLHRMDAPFESFLAYLHIYRSRAGKPCPPACWCHHLEEWEVGV